MIDYARVFLLLFGWLPALPAWSQADSSFFRVRVINESGRPVHLNFLTEDHSIGAGETVDFSRKVPDEFFPFHLSVYTGDPPAVYQSAHADILSDTISRQVHIAKTGEITLISGYSERMLTYYTDHRTEEHFIDLSDSLMNAQKDDIAAAGILAIEYCRYGIDTKDIRDRYDRLSEPVKRSLPGKKVLGYLEGRDRLQEHKLFSDFALPDSNDKPVRLSDVKSRYILLDFWFSQCGPCLASFPELIRFYQKTTRDRFQVIGLSVDGRQLIPLWKSTIGKAGLPWINLLDSDYKICHDYSVGNFPTKILLDRDRRIVKIDPSVADLEQILQQSVP
ncbi:MAG: TlpA disulfide reductase family protein [Puia sp.]|nr:TlpA disulfide reductase family protein [Puia sp.]